MRKLLTRLGLGVALVAAAGGAFSATAAKAAAPDPVLDAIPVGGGFWDLCHDTLVLGTVDCIVTSRDPGVNFLVHILDHHGVFVGQDGVLGDAFTGADITLLHSIRLLAGQFSDGFARDSGAELDVFDPLAHAARGASVDFVNDPSAPDEGHIQLYDEARGHQVSIVWGNGWCGVEYDRTFVAPCLLRIVPILPYVPYVPLP